MNQTSDLSIIENQGFLIRRNVNFQTTNEFNDYCSTLGNIWTDKIHKIHNESIDDGNVIQWSTNTRFKKNSIPWHCDNPWHLQYRFPLRVLYGVKIPDEDDGKLWICNMVNWFEKLSEKRKNYFRNLRVLMQDYKRGCSPYWTSLVKQHPVTKKESLNWGAMSVESKVFGLQTDEKFVHKNSYMITIENNERIKISDIEISSWWQEMIDDNLYCHKWKKNDLVILDNWTTAHYREKIYNENERLLWRRTVKHLWNNTI